MSTVDLAANTWMRFENTAVVAQVWSHQDEQEGRDAEASDPSALQGELAGERKPTLPDDFWQEWFGIWR